MEKHPLGQPLPSDRQVSTFGIMLIGVVVLALIGAGTVITWIIQAFR